MITQFEKEQIFKEVNAELNRKYFDIKKERALHHDAKVKSLNDQISNLKAQHKRTNAAYEVECHSLVSRWYNRGKIAKKKAHIEYQRAMSAQDFQVRLDALCSEMLTENRKYDMFLNEMNTKKIVEEIELKAKRVLEYEAAHCNE